MPIILYFIFLCVRAVHPSSRRGIRGAVHQRIHGLGRPSSSRPSLVTPSSFLSPNSSFPGSLNENINVAGSWVMSSWEPTTQSSTTATWESGSRTQRKPSYTLPHYPLLCISKLWISGLALTCSVAIKAARVYIHKAGYRYALRYLRHRTAKLLRQFMVLFFLVKFYMGTETI